MKEGERKQHVPIFVGSTFEDLMTYRRAVRDALAQLEMVVRGMEYFGSKPGSPVDECLSVVRTCKIYIGIFGMRYGSVPEGYCLSMTHLEYDEAHRCQLPSLIYIINEEVQPILPKYVETGPGAEALKKLKDQLKKRHVVSYFTSPEDLAAKILHDVPNVLRSVGAIVEAPPSDRGGPGKSLEATEVELDRGNRNVQPNIEPHPIHANDRPFVHFWWELIDGRKLVIIHAVPVDRPEKRKDWPTDMDREGINILNRAFTDKWPLRNPVEDHSSAELNIELILDSNDILLSGGAVSNVITRKYFNHFPGLRYVIDYTMPYYTDIRILDRISSTRITAMYEYDEFGNRTPTRDVGILTVMRNPMNKARSLLGCMGIHGFGTFACLKVLSQPTTLSQLSEMIKVPTEDRGYQILVEYNASNAQLKLLEKTLHNVEA